MKKLDPEGAAQRGVLEDELSGGDGSAESLEATKRRKAEAARRKAAGESSGGFEMPKVGMPEMPKMGLPELPKLPNPFEKK